MRVGERSILEHIWDSWNEVVYEKVPILATTSRSSDDELTERAMNIGYNVYRGDLHDVLSRFQEISRVYKLDLLLRFTGDNPFIDSEMVTRAIETFISQFTKDDAFFLSTRNSFMPIGMDIEIFSWQVIDLIPAPTDSYNKEHVTPWMYSNRRVRQLLMPSKLPKNKYSVTVDTIEELEKIREIYRWLNHRRPKADLIISFFENRQ
jgi:spore coat polysaccharide biosynthesis protein SpsF